MTTAARQFIALTLTISLLAALGILATGCSSDDGDGGGGVTDPVVDSTAPADVTSFFALPGNGQVTLRWTNPFDGDLAGVMLRRGTDSAPTIDSGEVVFEGSGTSFVDQGRTNETMYYYTAFTFDYNDNFSTGVADSCTPRVAAPITIADENLELVIREELGIPDGDITDLDMLSLLELDASNRSIADLQGIEYCLNMEDLDLSNNDLGAGSHTNLLAGLPKLRQLILNSSNIEIIPDLSDLTLLETLRIIDNPLSSLTPLSGVTSLVTLQFGLCPAVNDLAPLGSLTNLSRLDFQQTSITSLNGLDSLNNLEQLGITGDEISSLSPISALPNLTYLYVTGASNLNIEDLSGMSQLETLGLLDVGLEDLSDFAGLTNLEHLDIYGNNVQSIADLAALNSLKHLWAMSNYISDISLLTDFQELIDVNLTGNPLTTEDVLSHIPTLEGAGIEVNFTHDAELVDIMGPWSIASVTVDGVDSPIDDFFGWEDGEVSGRLFIFPNGNHEYRDLDAGGNIFYYETGFVAVDGTGFTLTVVAEDGVVIDPAYEAFDGTWAKTAGNLVLSMDDDGAVIALTWSR